MQLRTIEYHAIPITRYTRMTRFTKITRSISLKQVLPLNAGLTNEFVWLIGQPD